MIALQALLVNPEVSTRVLKTVLGWVASGDSEALSRQVFVDVFTHTGSEDTPSVAHVLLTMKGAPGDAARQMLREGWQAVWQQDELRGQSAEVFGSWCDAVGDGLLPADAVEEVVTVVFSAEADALGDELNQLIGGRSPFRTRLRTRFVDIVRERAVRQAHTDPATNAGRDTDAQTHTGTDTGRAA